MRSFTSWKDLLSPGKADDFFERRSFPPFDPQADRYHAANALWLCELSRLVYRIDAPDEDPRIVPRRADILSSKRLREVSFFESVETDTQAMLVERRDSPVYSALVFRGTEQKIKDFVTDLRIGPTPLLEDGIAVHEGFRIALDSIWPDIQQALNEMDSPIFFTGHSLGGALATVAAARWTPQALYTFGSPRVGNAAFVETLRDVPTYRIVDDWDLVPIVPPETLGFEHVGELIQLHERQVRFSINPFAWLRLAFSPAKPLADHAPVNYVDRI